MQTVVINNPGDVRVPIEAVPNPVAKVRVQEPKPEKKQVDSHEFARLQTALAQHDISLKFSKDETTDRIVVQMIDGRTGEAIRQFPTEVSLNLAANFMKLQGVFLDVEK
ncbi:MAG: flagellar protein FlaG [Pyrinomonadaceae bacterium]